MKNIVISLVLLAIHQIWFRFLRKTETTAVSFSTKIVGRVMGRLFKKESIMEKDVALGTVGKLALSFSGGKAIVGASAQLPAGLNLSFSASDDAGALIDQLEALVQKELPAGQAIEASVFAIIKSVVIGIA